MTEGAVVAVRETWPLSVDVSELLRIPGSSIAVRSTSPAEGFALVLAEVDEGSDLQIDLLLEALVDGVHVSGSVEAAVTLRCRRCLREIHERRRVDVDELASYPGEERDDAYPIAERRIDLGPMMRDVVVGQLPTDPLCRTDCRGLCPVCGRDRNEADCGHDDGPQDVRWGPLAELRDRLMGG